MSPKFESLGKRPLINMGHPLHFAIAEEINQRLDNRFKLIRDSACGTEKQQIPLFVGQHKSSKTRMCCVDL